MAKELAGVASSWATGATSGRNSSTAETAALAASAVRTIGRFQSATCCDTRPVAPGRAEALFSTRLGDSSMAALTLAAKDAEAMRPPGARAWRGRK